MIERAATPIERWVGGIGLILIALLLYSANQYSSRGEYFILYADLLNEVVLIWLAISCIYKLMLIFGQNLIILGCASLTVALLMLVLVPVFVFKSVSAEWPAVYYFIAQASLVGSVLADMFNIFNFPDLILAIRSAK